VGHVRYARVVTGRRGGEGSGLGISRRSVNAGLHENRNVVPTFMQSSPPRKSAPDINFPSRRTQRQGSPTAANPNPRHGRAHTHACTHARTASRHTTVHARTHASPRSPKGRSITSFVVGRVRCGKASGISSELYAHMPLSDVITAPNRTALPLAH
jgi:hypothetical protein